MSVTPKLINATPFDAKIPYEKGLNIRVPGDSEVALSTQQMEDFMPGTPGYEVVRTILEENGLFLLDVDLSYDTQALRTLEACIRHKSEAYKGFVDTRRRNALEAGQPITDEALEAVVVQYGYRRLREEIEVLEKRISKLRAVVADDPTKGRLKETLDPERTCFVTEPPRQFPSRAALEMFLDENPSIKEAHDAFVAQLNAPESKKVKKQAENENA